MPDEAAPKPLNLALQGGGAHGAFTWGVLDRLLEEDGLAVEGISGTSAGAMNGAMVALGFERDGAAGARAALERLWRAVADAARFSPVQRSLFDGMPGGNPWNMDYSPGFLMFDALTRIASPYQFNPLDLNPLRELLEGLIDEGELRSCRRIKLFVCATNVRTGKARIFSGDQLSIDALLASACLPQIHRAVEIDGEAYWDGGYMGNPAIYPLIYDCASPDVAIVQINPITRDEVPTTAAEIMNRVNEISFNSTLMREVRAIAFVQKLMREARLPAERYKFVNLHLIGDEEKMAGLGVASKLNAGWDFLCHLRQVGRDAADGWLGRNRDRIGVETTVDLQEVFL
ncbi:MAG TPA: patatin-like phospholipase family protein [Alphaproteobacteria bacterium]|nr:patatin-like phospholipase family protein [Alphaproteobacteria bacterium]